MRQFPHGKFESRVESALPGSQWCDELVLVAVSGGADSTALLRAMAAIQNRRNRWGCLYAAHLHHGLRGTAADADQAWLEELCRRLGIPLTVGRADVQAAAAQAGDGWEAAARACRYDFLRRTAEQLGARYVATAHTADDQVETVLHRVFRGTGLAGLSGMAAFRPLSPSVTLARPLLGTRRSDVLAYLAELGQDHRSDATNQDPRFTRNWLRHHLLPNLRENVNSDVDAAVLRLANQAAEMQEFVSRLAAELADQCVHRLAGGSVSIDCRQLVGRQPLIIREICRKAWTDAGFPQQAMGYNEWQQLASLAANSGDHLIVPFPGRVHAERTADILILSSAGGLS